MIRLFRRWQRDWLAATPPPAPAPEAPTRAYVPAQARNFHDCIRLCQDPMTDDWRAHVERERLRWLAEVAAGR